MAKIVTRRNARTQVAVTPLISYQPFGVRKRGRGVAYEWSFPVVLQFVEEGINLKEHHLPPPKNAYIVGYDRVGLRTLQMVRRWLLMAQGSAKPIIEVPSTGAFEERYDCGGYITVAKWFGFFIHDGRHQSIFCPKCKKSYPKDRLKFVIGFPDRCTNDCHGRAPTYWACPKKHLLLRT